MGKIDLDIIYTGSYLSKQEQSRLVEALTEVFCTAPMLGLSDPIMSVVSIPTASPSYLVSIQGRAESDRVFRRARQNDSLRHTLAYLGKQFDLKIWYGLQTRVE